MLGKSKQISQGKRTMCSSDPINIYHQLIELPPTIKGHYGNVKIAVDCLHMNDIPLLTSVSNHANYGTSNAVDNMKADSLEKGLKNVIRCYEIKGFRLVFFSRNEI